MSELAAFLVDEVIPHAPVRQVVLSFPFPVRFWISKNPNLQTQLLAITIRAYSNLLRKKAKAQGLTQKLQYAVVTVIQRMGGSINLRPTGSLYGTARATCEIIRCIQTSSLLYK